MTDHDLDETYTAMSQALGRVGEREAALFLATLSLALIARQSHAGEVLSLIAQAEALVQA